MVFGTKECHSTATNLKNKYERKSLKGRVRTSESDHRMARSQRQCRELKKEAIAALQGRRLRDEVRRGIRGYKAAVDQKHLSQPE